MISISERIRFLVTLVALLTFFTSNAQQVWYVNSGIGNDTYDGTSSTDDGGGVGPFMTIQYAVNSAADLDTIRVAAGDYTGYLLIDKALIVLGANEGIGGTETRNAETVLYPAQIGLSSPADASNSLVQIANDDVTFEGFKLNGNNDTLSSSVVVNGEDVDRSYGVLILGEYDRVVVRNNQVVNFERGGIEALGNVNSPNSNCFFGYNLFQNFGNGSIAVTCGNGFYTDIFANTIQGSQTGISLYDFTMNAGRPFLISQNILDIRSTGIVLSALNSNTSNVYVDNNRISTVTGFFGDEGVFVKNCVGNYNLEIRDCRIVNFESGILMLNNDLPVRFALRDTLESCNAGFTSTTINTNSRRDSLSFESCFLNECPQTAISVFADSTNTVVQMDDCLIKDCGRGIYAAGNVHLRPSATEFETISTYYIELDTTNSDIVNKTLVDARRCLFDGNTGKSNAHIDNFNIEDKIRHYMDTTLFGHVLFNDSNLYVSNIDNNDVVMRAVGFASEDWHIHIRDVVSAEQVSIGEQLHLTTYNDVKLGTMSVNLSGGKEVFLHDTLTLVDGLTLNSGRLNTRDGLCSVGEILVKSGQKSVVANGASYVDGPLQVVLQTTGVDTLVFPVGTSNSYRPLEIHTQNTTTGNWDRVQATLVSGNTPNLPVSNGLSHVSELHHWALSTTNNLSHDNLQYKASYSVFGTNDQAGDAGSLRLANVQNGEWTNINGNGSANDNGTIQSVDPVSDITDLILANAKSGLNRLGKGDVVAAFDAQSVCDGESIKFTENSTALVGTITGYKWDFGDAAVINDTSNVANPTYQYNGPGLYDVRLIVTSDMNESDTTVRTIRVYANPIVGFIEEIHCFPEPARFIDTSSVAGPDVIEFRNWDIDGALYSINPVSHSFPATGNYTAKLVIETQFGCKDSVSKSFFQGDSVKMAVTPQGPVSICQGDSITLTATAGLQRYDWSSGETTQTIEAKQATMYIVTGYNSNFCFGIDSTRVQLVPSPSANAGPDVSIEYGASTTLQGSGGSTYTWSPPDGLSDPTDPSAIATPLVTTTYILTVSNAQGCTDQDTMIVTVGLPKQIKIPNVISPNGDMVNDVWDLSEIQDLENTKVSVLNRWGKVVFTATNYQNDWDGSFEGEPLPDGTYLYIIEGSQFYETLKGQMQIIR